MMHQAPKMDLRDEGDFWVSPSLMPAGAVIRATVVIPAFGAAATLQRAVQSALNQTLREIEVIVVDDASTDHTWRQVVEMLPTESRLRAIRHKANSGKSIAMNRALALAKGHWLAVLDADDWYHTERLARLIAVAERWQADLVADNQYFFDATANRVVDTAWPSRPSDWELTFDDYLVGADAYATFNLGMLKPVLRADFMRRSGLAYEVAARHGQDFLYLLEFFLLGGRAVVSDRPSYYYTQPFGMISHRWSHPARKRYDFQTAYELNQRYLMAAFPLLSADRLARLEDRNRRLKVLESYYSARELLAQRDWRGALVRFASQPDAALYFLRRLLARLFGYGSYRTIRRIAARSRRRAGLLTGTNPGITDVG